MLVDPDLYEIVNGARGMIKGIDACIEAQCLVSAVALIYSTIDALSALTRPSDKVDTDRSVFLDWVEKYIRPQKTLKCTAHDLYGARCGILHQYGTNSRLRREGKAKPLIYEWKDGPHPDPGHRTHLPPDALYLCVEDLREALESAAIKFLGSLDRNNDLKARVDQHRQELLCYKPWSVVSISVAA